MLFATVLVGNDTFPTFANVVVKAALKDLVVELEKLTPLKEFVVDDNDSKVELDKGPDEVEEVKLIEEVLLITEEVLLITEET